MPFPVLEWSNSEIFALSNMHMSSCLLLYTYPWKELMYEQKKEIESEKYNFESELISTSNLGLYKTVAIIY